MSMSGKLLRETLLAAALLTRGQGAEAANSSAPASHTHTTNRQLIGVGEAPAGAQENTSRGHGLRQMRERNAQHHAQQSADDRTVDGVLGNMSEAQKGKWLEDTFSQVLKDMTAKGIRMDKKPIGRVRFNPDDSTSVTSKGTPETMLDVNYVQVNESHMKGLTVKEFKAVLAHEAMHTQTADCNSFEEFAANERTADHAAARTYGGKTFASGLRKAYDNMFSGNPDTTDMMKTYYDAAQLRLAFPQAGRKSASQDTVAAATSGMTETQRDAWLQNLSQRVQKDMQASGIVLPGAAATKVAFVRGENAGQSEVDKNEVTLNEQQVQRLSVRELQSVLALSIGGALQPDPTADAALNVSMAMAARTYGGKTLSHALGEMQRGEVPHDPLQKRQDEAIKTNPGSAAGRAARWVRSHILPH